MFGGATPTTVTIDATGVTVGNLWFTGGAYTVAGPGTLTLSNSVIDVASGLSTLFSVGLGGTTGLAKANAGTLILTGTNTYSGGTTITGGTLQIGNGGTTGSLGSGNVANSGVLVFNRSNAVSLSNVISGTGSMIQSGAGLLTLSGASTFSGDVLIKSGTLSANVKDDNTNPTSGALGNPAALHTVTVQNGATLLFAQTNVFGNAGSTINTALVVDGGMVSYADNSGKEETLGLVTLKNGAILNSINGGTGSYQAYALTNTVTATGTAPSQITTTGTTNIGVNLQSTITFAVDVTGGTGADLTIRHPPSERLQHLLRYYHDQRWCAGSGRIRGVRHCGHDQFWGWYAAIQRIEHDRLFRAF